MASSRPQIGVLLVDDLEGVRELYSRYLSFRGLRVTTANDGFAALRAVSDARPDALVIDLAMPGMSGEETIRALRAQPEYSSLPIIVLSGRNEPEAALAAGANSYMEKPCRPEALLQEVLRMLPHRASSGDATNH